MKFGTFHLFQKPAGWTDEGVFRAELEQIQKAEELGFDAVWLAEHHFQWYGIATDLMQIGAWVAARTERVRIGTAVVVLPFHNPLRLAEQAATLDLLSGGRLDLGVGRGYQAAEYSGFNISMDESRARFAECVEVLVKAWTQETFSHEGKYTQVRDVSVLPKPAQKPHPPIYVASWMTPETIRFAAERGFPIMSPAGLAADQIKTNYQLYAETLESLGRDASGLELPALIHIYVDENDERARRTGMEHARRYGASLATLGTSVQPDGELSSEYQHYKQFADAGAALRETRQELMLFGNPDSVAHKLKWVRDELGVRYVMCWMNMGGLEPERVLTSMRLFAEEVIPRFRTVEAKA
ncbi:MAG: LLM class flavin-dependent oxidoreductase [Dehalococcoidia bacterium]|nr:LLM class flavin-dependent oxidoreductase [Dehalococcoidia bacterium]